MGVYARFADILAYPGPRLPEAVAECAALLEKANGEAARALGEFRAFVGATPMSRIEEIYTGVFDLAPACSPHLGHHLFGEDFRRSLFMVRLQGHYRERGFAAGPELPDHLAVVLRFLDGAPEGEVEQELVELCVAPALKTMIERPGGESNPYRAVLSALLLVIGRT